LRSTGSSACRSLSQVTLPGELQSPAALAALNPCILVRQTWIELGATLGAINRLHCFAFPLPEFAPAVAPRPGRFSATRASEILACARRMSRSNPTRPAKLAARGRSNQPVFPSPLPLPAAIRLESGAGIDYKPADCGARTAPAPCGKTWNSGQHAAESGCRIRLPNQAAVERLLRSGECRLA
jgi:hypothetical protein